MYDHVFIVGGTGMLRQASRALAARCQTLTSVARTGASLQTLHDDIAHLGLTHHRLALGWRDSATFVRSLATHINRVGYPSLAVVWVHQDSLGSAIASVLARRCDFFQVHGSAAADSPACDLEQSTATNGGPEGRRRHQVILGFHRDVDGARWLTDTEISNGVLNAVAQDDAMTVAGTVTPWSSRP